MALYQSLSPEEKRKKRQEGRAKQQALREAKQQRLAKKRPQKKARRRPAAVVCLVPYRLSISL